MSCIFAQVTGPQKANEPIIIPDDENNETVDYGEGELVAEMLDPAAETSKASEEKKVK